MLKLTNITKDYKVAGSIFSALKGVSVTFRNNEFVSILGPSGSGKTTLLNIIGGLDHYTNGDLIIDGVSTKEFSDRDWDNYRNHKIGFVFQSYNLIPHQTILQNVELALTISGVGKEERTRRAKEALEKVGLGNMVNKRPNTLSGGQCQRVAIARALVNEPSILLADEPTGALDSVTSVQIMDLIKEIAKDRLVIMVTHNPELAKQYSTRIVELHDGNITNDTDPFDGADEVASKPKNEKKAKLSVFQAARLSGRNLRSKFKRTLMISLAGSIGIIGVAAVLAVSTGVRGYINSMQDDMLSGNPISVAENGMDLSSMLSQTSSGTQTQIVASALKDGQVNVRFMIEQLVKNSRTASSFQIKNTITDDYVAFCDAMPTENYAAMQKYYGIDPTNNIFTDMKFSGIEEGDVKAGPYSLSGILNICVSILKQEPAVKQYADLVTTLTSTFSQTLSNEPYVLDQYDIAFIPGRESKYPVSDDEIMIVLDKNDMLTDLLLVELGYYSQEEFVNIVHHYVNLADDDPNNDEEYKDIKKSFSVEELLGKEFTYYPNDVVYGDLYWNTSGGNAVPMGVYNYRVDNTFPAGKKLKITSILTPKKDVNYGCLSSGFYFTENFTRQFIEDGKESTIYKDMVAHNVDVISSMDFNGAKVGLSYNYDFVYEGHLYSDTSFVGKGSALSSILSSYMQSNNVYSLSSRHIGGESVPSRIDFYPKNFDKKSLVTDYLSRWNSDETLTLYEGSAQQKEVKKADRADITFTDNLSVIISMVDNVINVVTYALVAFTALSLVVSTVMISIITLVSVLERIKEIGVIRSLGGRKRDVANLFIAETFMIGLSSGVLGVAITYVLQILINIVVGALTGIYTLANFTPVSALIMIAVSVLLTSLSGIVPAMSAADKDPVVALRTE